MNAQMSNKSKPNNSMNESQGLSSSRCPIGEQDRPVSHQATTDRSTMRRKWSQEENKATMQYYYRSEYGRNGYSKGMHVIWNEIGMFNVTNQRLVDQKYNILISKWLLDLEWEEIQRDIEDIRHDEVRLESNEDEGWFFGFDHEGHDVFYKRMRSRARWLNGAKCSGGEKHCFCTKDEYA